MPTRVLRAYKNFQEVLTARNAVAGHMGQEYPKPTSIPQGDPLSMMVVALIMRPWIELVKQEGVKPRVFADDIMLYAKGDGHEEALTKSYGTTHRYLEDMGARLAPSKSSIFSTSKATRSRMRLHKWQYAGDAVIQVINNFRDLGAHVNLTNAANSKTINDRVAKGVGKVHRIASMQANEHTTAMGIKVFSHPFALYGAEVAQPSDNLLGRYQAATATAICKCKGQRAVDAAYNTCSDGRDLDPEVAVMIMRVSSLRRFLETATENFEKVQRLMMSHIQKETKGTCIEEAYLEAFEESSLLAPMPGRGPRKRWKPFKKERGPIALLLSQLHRIGAGMDEDCIIYKHDEAPLDIGRVPWQQLKSAVAEMAARARTRACAGTRRDNIGTMEVDIEATKCEGKITAEDRRCLWRIQVGAVWTKDYLFKNGEVIDDKCPHCGARHTIKHVLWECPAHQQLRHEVDAELAKVDHNYLPEAVLIGIAPAMKGAAHETFWGQDTMWYEGDTKELVGGYKDRKNSDYTEELMRQISELLNYRQFFARMRGPKDEVQAPVLSEVLDAEFTEEEPPEMPNVYTDGSVANPALKKYGLGGAGAWWPSRRNGALSTIEEGAEYVQYDVDGLGFAKSVGGYHISSTRAEVAAALLALACKGAVHIAADNKAMVDKGNKLLAIARAFIRKEMMDGCTHEQARAKVERIKPLGKPWGWTVDG